MRLRLKQRRLVELLAASQLSQNHWAIKLGLSRGHWSAIVNGKHLYPSPRTRVRMLEVFQLPLEELFAIEAGPVPWGDTDFRRAIAADYLVDAELGQGGMGAVYLARDTRHGRVVAVKVVAREAVSGIGLEQFQREIATVAQLQHSNVLPLFDSGEAAGHPYFVMPLVRGGSLRARLTAQTRLDLAGTLRLVRGIADALHYAHSEHVLHCDVKPENVLLQGDHAWVSDFGIARKLHAEALEWPMRGELDLSAGTPAYVSPEQAAGERELDARSDVYSLGCMVFEMLSGRTPFGGGSTQEIVSQRFIIPPPPLRDFAPEVPRAVEGVIEQAMSLPRERRPDTAVAFAGELERAAAGTRPVVVAVSLAASRAVARVRRRMDRPATSPLGGFVRSLFHWTDLRDAARSLVRAPALALSAILCLGLGLGSTTAIYSAIDRALLRPLPFPEPERLVSVFRTTPQFVSGPFSAPNYTDLSQGRRSFATLAAATPTAVLVSLADAAMREPAYLVTAGFFPVLGARPALGRLLGDADTAAGAPAAVVMSYELWRQRFGGDSALVGTTLTVDGAPRTVVGIAPRAFRVPHGGQMIGAALWLPLTFSANQMNQRRSNFLYMVGRLATGATPATAEAELRAAFNGLVQAYPQLRGEQVRVAPVQAEAMKGVRTPLLLVMGAVGFVLLVAVANVASLLLARGVQRRREMAIRTALGGGRWAVIRPVMAESLLLAGCGAALGLGLATLGVRTIGRLAGERLPQLAGLGIDLRVVAFAVLLTLVVSLLCSAAPAWHAAAADPQDALRGGTGGGPGRQHHRALGALVMAELALSVVLLLGAGLVMKGFVQLMQREPGFDPARLLKVELTVSSQTYPDNSSVRRFLEPVLAAIGQVPGVTQAGALSLIPYQDWGWNFNMWYEGQPGDDPTRLPLVERRVVTPGLFATTGQRLIAGRLLTAADDERDASPPVVVVNEALVKRDFPGGDVIGKRFHIGDTTFATIVGVVSDVRNFGPVDAPHPEVYWTYRMGSRGSTGFPVLIRSDGDPASLRSAVEAAVRSVDPTASVSEVAPMTEVIARSVGRPRFYLTLLGVFAGVAVVLAMAGLYGVLSYAVVQRTREIGIRAALGSTAGSTIRLIMRRGMGFVAGGLVVGLAAGALVTRLLSGLLYGVSPLDPLTWVLVTVALGGTGLLATLIPARRATRVDPLVALRSD